MMTVYLEYQHLKGEYNMQGVFNKKDLEIMNTFYNERCINKRTQYGYNNSFSLYIQYTRMHLYDLLTEADLEEEKGIRWKRCKLKEKLIGFRRWLQEKYKYSTIKVLWNRIKTFYTHFEIEIGFIPQLNKKSVIQSEPITYDDIPTKEMLHDCLEYANPLMKALILFMSSSGCARRETLNLTIQEFIEATAEYHSDGNINEILTELIMQDNVIPTFRIRRQKTNKFYYTFCSPEATKAICAYLLSSGRRFDKGHNAHLVFKTNLDALGGYFKELNDLVDAGQVADMNRIRSHMLRKFHASRLYNDGMSIDKIDALQGRAKDNTHKAYFKESAEALKELYIEHIDAIRI